MAEQSDSKTQKLLQVGQFAKAIGKTVRAVHLYEEMGLLRPVARSKGGFRLYDEYSAQRAQWIIKLQGIGFTLAQIQGFVADFEGSTSGRDATARAREIFQAKLSSLQEQLAKLQNSERDLLQALEYLEACGRCSTELSPEDCRYCNQQGHDSHNVPNLVAGLSSDSSSSYDVDAESLRKRVDREELDGEELDGEELDRDRLEGDHLDSPMTAEHAVR